MFCAQVSPKRAHTLCTHDLNCVGYCENEINFVVMERLKTSTPVSPRVNLSVPAGPNYTSICPKTN